jgi:hypothetical protein
LHTVTRRRAQRLNALAKKLKARRIAAGALTLASPEVRFDLWTKSSFRVAVTVTWPPKPPHVTGNHVLDNEVFLVAVTVTWPP